MVTAVSTVVQLLVFISQCNGSAIYRRSIHHQSMSAPQSTHAVSQQRCNLVQTVMKTDDWLFSRGIVCFPEMQSVPDDDVPITAQEVKDNFTAVCQQGTDGNGRECDEYYVTPGTYDHVNESQGCIQDSNQTVDASLPAINSCFQTIQGFDDILADLIAPDNYTKIRLRQFDLPHGTDFIYSIDWLHSQIFGVPSDPTSFFKEYYDKVNTIVTSCHCDVPDWVPDVMMEPVDGESSVASYSDLDYEPYEEIPDEHIRDYIATALRIWNETLRALWNKLYCRLPRAQQTENDISCPDEPVIC